METAMARKLRDIPEPYWGNHILYKLAEALGEPVEQNEEGDTWYEADADELLERACEVIWAYTDMADS